MSPDIIWSTRRLYSADESKTKRKRGRNSALRITVSRTTTAPWSASALVHRANRYERFTKRNGIRARQWTHTEGPNGRNEHWEGVSSRPGLGAQSKTPRDLIDRRAIGRGVEIWRGPGEHSIPRDLIGR